MTRLMSVVGTLLYFAIVASLLLTIGLTLLNGGSQ